MSTGWTSLTWRGTHDVIMYVQTVGHVREMFIHDDSLAGDCTTIILSKGLDQDLSIGKYGDMQREARLFGAHCSLDVDWHRDGGRVKRLSGTACHDSAHHDADGSVR